MKKYDFKEWKKLNTWNDKNSFQKNGCPKCGSFNIMENGQRGRSVITSLRCKDCNYVWRIKK